MGRTGNGRSWRHIRALTLVILGLLLAAPLSSGDKGLWLSLAATPVLLDTPAGGLPAEHSTLLPDQPGRSLTSLRVEQGGAGKRLATVTAIWASAAGERWPATDAAPTQALHALFAARPDPRAPPV